MRRLFIICFFLLTIPFFLFSQKKLTDINSVKFFNSVPLNDGNFYFSFLNPNYTEQKEKQYIVNALGEVIKFSNLEIAVASYDQTFGSYIISDTKVKTSYDGNLMETFFPLIKVIQLVPTKYGDVITVMVTKSKMASVWSNFNKGGTPDYNFQIDDSTNDSRYPSWFLKPPECEGYIFGVGAYSKTSKITDLFINADATARAEVVKVLRTKVTTEFRDYIEDNFEVTDFFSNKSASANIGGIYIVRRYFDEKKKISYSLAVLKL